MQRIRQAWAAFRRSLPYTVAGISVLLCLWCATEATTLGLSQLYAARAIASNDVFLATRAVLLTPSDPNTYRARATVLAAEGRFDEATVDLTRAVALSPGDWELWVQLGAAQKQRKDMSGAVRAYSEAARWAPGYAHPHWQLGNCLLAAGRVDEAFIELRRASTIMPSLFSEALELAWQSYNGEPQAIERALQPQTVHERIALAMFLGKHGRSHEADLLMKDADRLPEGERASLLRELLDAGRFEEAYEVWSAGTVKADAPYDAASSIANGGFESEIVLDDRGFGWRFTQGSGAMSASLDISDPHSGKQSLRLDWHGDPDRSAPVVQQLVLIAPNTRYRLNFAARTQLGATICAPMITVADPKATVKSLLAQSSALPLDSSGWRDYTLEFTTEATTKVILIGITRQAGTEGRCPIFGSTWFDDFSLVQI